MAVLIIGTKVLSRGSGSAIDSHNNSCIISVIALGLYSASAMPLTSVSLCALTIEMHSTKYGRYSTFPYSGPCLKDINTP